MTTNLTLHLSHGFLLEVTGTSNGTNNGSTQGGSWAYIWNKTPPPDVAPSPLLPPNTPNNWTPLVLNSALTGNVTYNATHDDYEVQIALTDGSMPTIAGGSLYLIVQS